MTPDSPCSRQACRHALKWHNPCSKCPCQAFAASSGSLAARGPVAALPTGSVTPEALATGHVTPSGLLVPKGGKR